MANRTVKEAKSIKGTNPQYLVEKIIRTRIYDCQYWKEKCFALSAELLVDEAMSLDHVGGVFGGNIKPTPFICLILKMLQIQPSKDIIIEFIKNPDYKYVRVLGCLYLRLVGTSVECYKYLEPLYSDYRKVKIKNRQGNLTLSHVDEFIDNLLREDRVCDVILPRLQKRHILEETEQVEPRVSALDDDLEGEESEEEEVESEEEEEEVESKRRSRSPRHHRHHSSRSPNRSSRRSRSRSPNRRRSRSRSPYERRNRSRSPRYMTRRRSYSRSPVSRLDRYSRRSPSPYSSSHRHRRRSYSPENRKERRGRDRYDNDEQEEYRSGRDKVDKERRHKEEKKSKKDKKEKKEKKSRKKDKEKTSKSSSSSNKKELEIQEANELRAKLGIKPLKVD